jgi:hypothetical protein
MWVSGIDAVIAAQTRFSASFNTEQSTAIFRTSKQFPSVPIRQLAAAKFWLDRGRDPASNS